MKKLFTIALAFVYLAFSSGLLLEVHHCMGKIADMGLAVFAADNQDACDSCGMDLEDGSSHCCKNEYKMVKIQSDQKPGSQLVQPDAPAPVILPVEYPGTPARLLTDRTNRSARSHAPPLFIAAPTQADLCVFRI